MRKLTLVLAVGLALLGLSACGSDDDVTRDLKPYPAYVTGDCSHGYVVHVDKRPQTGIREVIVQDAGATQALWWIQVDNKTKPLRTITIGQTPPGYTVKVPLTPDALKKARRVEVDSTSDGTYTAARVMKVDCKT